MTVCSSPLKAACSKSRWRHFEMLGGHTDLEKSSGITDFLRARLRWFRSQMSHTKPYIRKKAVLIMYKVFLKYPESLRPAFPRLKEKLEDPDPGEWISVDYFWIIFSLLDSSSESGLPSGLLSATSVQVSCSTGNSQSLCIMVTLLLDLPWHQTTMSLLEQFGVRCSSPICSRFRDFLLHGQD